MQLNFYSQFRVEICIYSHLKFILLNELDQRNLYELCISGISYSFVSLMAYKIGKLFKEEEENKD